MIVVSKKAEHITSIRARDLRAAPSSQKRGVIVSRAYEGGPEQTADLIQCCHCQRIFVYRRGSGTVRGWCMCCNGITCGTRLCDVCVPAEQMLKNLAAGMEYRQARTHRPIQASLNTIKATGKTASGIFLGRG